jgi:predicted transcriptional regulator
MSQQDILDVLKKENKPLSRTEIAEILEINATSVSLRLNKLLKYNEVKIIEIKSIDAKKLYNSNRAMKLYYV